MDQRARRGCAGTDLLRRANDPPFDRFGSVAGDCLHNIRSTLDHLVFEIADKTGEGGLPADVRKQSEFPVFGSHPMDKAARKRKIGTLPVDAQEFIESMQLSRLGANYEKHMLWVLHDLERIDKHRMPLSAEPMFGDMTISVPASAGIKARPGGRAGYQVQFNTPTRSLMVAPRWLGFRRQLLPGPRT